MNSFQQDRIAGLFRYFSGALTRFDNPVTSRDHRYVNAHRCIDRIRLVTHCLHRHHARPDKVHTMLSHQVGKVRVFGKETDTRMERVNALRFSDTDHRQCVEVTLIRGIATYADQGVLRIIANHIRRHRVHVRVRLDQDHFMSQMLGTFHQFYCRAPPGMNQGFLYGSDQVFFPRFMHNNNWSFPIQATRHDSINNLFNRLSWQRYGWIYPAQRFIVIR